MNYLDGDAKKHAGFAPLSRPRDLPRIYFSLQAVMKSGGDATPKIPGETLGEPLLQRDTSRVDRCGTQVAYRVNYAMDPAGGTNIAIERP